MDTVKIDFKPDSSPLPDGFQEDTGKAYSKARGYGWVRQDSLDNSTHKPLDITPNARDRHIAGNDEELNTLLHMQYPKNSSSEEVRTPAAWEYAIPDGKYKVTVSVGDQPNGSFVFDSQHSINVEGKEAIDGFQSDFVTRYDQQTVEVVVTDGRLTIDAIGGENTKINYVEVSEDTPTPSGKTIEVSTDGITVYGTPGDDDIEIDGADNVRVYPGAGDDTVTISSVGLPQEYSNNIVVIDDVGNDKVSIDGGTNHKIKTGSGDDQVDYGNGNGSGDLEGTTIDTGTNDDDVDLNSDNDSGNMTELTLKTGSGNDHVSLDGPDDEPNFGEDGKDTGEISFSTFDLGGGDDLFSGDTQTNSNKIYGGNGYDRITGIGGSNHDVLAGQGDDWVGLSTPSAFFNAADGTAKDTTDVTVSTGEGDDFVYFDAPEDDPDIGEDSGRIISNTINLGVGNDTFTDGIQTASNEILGGLGKDSYSLWDGIKSNSYEIISSQGDKLVGFIG